jgi:hypothetical protein
LSELQILMLLLTSLEKSTKPRSRLFLFEDEEVILAVGLGEIVAGDLVEAGALDFGTYGGLIEAVVGAVTIFVNDAEAGTGFEGRTQVGEHELGMGDLVVDLQHQGGIQRVRRELRVVRCAQERFDIGKMLALSALLDVGNGFGVDVLCNDAAVGCNAAGRADAEPAAAGADVGDGAAGFEVQEVHDAVDLEALVAAGRLEDAQVAGVGRAGGVRRRSGSLRSQARHGDDGNSYESGEQLAADGHII